MAIAIDGEKLTVLTDLTFSKVTVLWHLGQKLWVSPTAGQAVIRVCDLSAVASVDSSGLALLIEWQRLAAWRLQFINIPQALQLIADTAGVGSLLIPQAVKAEAKL